MKIWILIITMFSAGIVTGTEANRDRDIEIKMRNLEREYYSDISKIRQFCPVVVTPVFSWELIVFPERREELALRDDEIKAIATKYYSISFKGIPIKNEPQPNAEDPRDWGCIWISVTIDREKNGVAPPAKAAYAYLVQLWLSRMPAKWGHPKWYDIGEGKRLELYRFGCANEAKISQREIIEESIRELMAEAADKFVKYHE